MMKRALWLVMLVPCLSFAQDAAASDAPKEAPKVAAPAVKEPVKAKPFVTSAFAYGSRRAWFNGTQLLGGGLYYQASLVQGLGGYVRADGLSPFQMSGVRIVERHGFISTVLMKGLMGALAIVGMMGSAYANTSAVYDGYYTDGGRTFVVESVTLYQTDSQAAQFASDAAAMGALVDSVDPGQVAQSNEFGSGLWADFTVFDPRLALFNRSNPGASGYELTFGADVKLGMLFGLPVVLDIGLAMASIRAPRVDRPNGAPSTYLYDCFGAVGRLHVPLSRFVTFSLEWVLNFYALGYLTAPEELAADGRVVSMPLRANLELHLTDRFFARGSVVLGGLGLGDGRLGFGADLGVRL